ncbi:MAG: hypothetical protein UX07_C0009G0016 [Parcubacteria group bacterium GW2011_GWA2_45_30]|nr:MAG: hypothetical protein UX07_C0009G0016 [Parcubacteria group bacterium GW2011_GWA2_45_30]
MVFTQEKNAGFTLMEAVVVLGLITLLSTATLINFTGVNDALTLRKERFQAALAIREAQNMALAIRLLSGGVAAPAYGVNFSANSSTYFLFADRNNTRRYDSSPSPSDQKIGSDRIMEKGIKVGSIASQLNGPPPAVNITFASPEADARFVNNSGTNLGEWVEVTLTNRSGSFTTRIRVRTSGQVTLR